MSPEQQLAFWCEQVEMSELSWRERFRDWQCSPGDENWETTEAAVAAARALIKADDYASRPRVEQLALMACLSQSETIEDQDLTVALSLDAQDEELTELLRKRHEVIRQYRRFPARNRALKRGSTPAEAYFLTTAGQHYR